MARIVKYILEFNGLLIALATTVAGFFFLDHSCDALDQWCRWMTSSSSSVSNRFI